MWASSSARLLTTSVAAVVKLLAIVSRANRNRVIFSVPTKIGDRAKRRFILVFDVVREGRSRFLHPRLKLFVREALFILRVKEFPILLGQIPLRNEPEHRQRH